MAKIKKEAIFCWHEAYFKTTIYCGTYLGQSIFPGWHYLYDLRKNPEEILALATQGLKEALTKLNLEENDIVLITGSFYLAGEVLNLN